MLFQTETIDRVMGDPERFARDLPCRTIHGRSGPYLSRFTVADLPMGLGHVYLHFFHRGDEDLEVHDHPWDGKGAILSGGYRETRVLDATPLAMDFTPGQATNLASSTFHRVELLDPKAGCWTLFVTGPRVKSWGFRNLVTGLFTPWRDALFGRGLIPTDSRGEVDEDLGRLLEDRIWAAEVNAAWFAHADPERVPGILAAASAAREELAQIEARARRNGRPA